MEKFTLYINFRNTVIEYVLPAMNDKSFTADVVSGTDRLALSFEVYDGVWTLLSNEHICFFEDREHSKAVSSKTISDGDVIHALLNTGESLAVIVQSLSENTLTFVKYSIAGRSEVTIGRDADNDISVKSDYISAAHAVICTKSGGSSITDKSSNGTFINGKRISGEQWLEYGDAVYTIGFKMIFLGDVLAMNRSDIVKCSLPVYVSEVSVDDENKSEREDYFSRAPRNIIPLFREPVDIESPPSPQHQRNQPLIFVVGPSVTMPIPIMMSMLINSNINGGASRSYLGAIVSVVMSAAIGAGWALAHRSYNKKQSKLDEERRVSSYLEYIRKSRSFIAEKHSLNDSILMNSYLSSDVITERFCSDDTFIWNRNPRHKDFLYIRAGIGSMKFPADINVPKERFSVFNDELSELPHKIKSEFEYMDNTAVLTDLREDKIIGIIGEEKMISDVVRSLFIQITALHCYTDVKIAVFIMPYEYNEYGWLRWLPHIYSDDMKHRFAADDPITYKNALYSIDDILRNRLENVKNGSVDDNADILPHYIIFCTSETVFDGDPIEKYMNAAENIGVTFILAYKKMNKLPNSCKRIIECGSDFVGAYDLEKQRDELDRIELERIGTEKADLFSRKMSGMRVRVLSSGEIPASVSFFDMLGIGKIEQWELIKRYKENRVYEDIRSFIGIGSGGKPLYIDINEKKHGPHGLVAGTTGSGKSEALQTFIISLALNYSPDELAFILIDYKGGGMANAFRGMPHLAGIIDNLGDDDSESGEVDESLTRRALISINSEIKRRQSIFNRYGVNHVDQYIKMFRSGKTSDPLPHLIIISDEFAELKKEQPEFIKELVSAARVGRSLGIHLILATQKPGGVVDDEIWSNSRFKICLRVQDKQDSNGMLKRPEAAFLTQTGRAYFQLGNDEVFEQFQTGYSGAAYYPKETAAGGSESDIAMIGVDGERLVTSEQKSVFDNDENSVSQLEASVGYIIKVCAENNIRNTRPLWLPALSTDIVLDDIRERFGHSYEGITAIYGLIDHPARQKQMPASVNLTDCSNLLISGMSGMGKTTLLETLIMSLMTDYSCEEVQFYILDFSGGTLRVFRNAPHCGFISFAEDREGTVRTLRFIDKEIENRRKMFSAENLGSYSEYVRMHKLPLIIFVIENYSGFNEQYPDYQEDFIKITRDSSKYGIQVIVTCTHLNDMRSRVSQNFSDTITLIMDEKSDYRTVWKVSPEFMPKAKKGRGLTLCDGTLLEYQAALPVNGRTETDRNDVIAERIKMICERDKELIKPQTVKTLPKDQTRNDFISENTAENFIPVAYLTDSIEVCGADLMKAFCFAVSDAGTRGASLVLENAAASAKMIGSDIWLAKFGSDINIKVSGVSEQFTDSGSVRRLADMLHDELIKRAEVKRMLLDKDPEADFTPQILAKFPKITVIIDSISDLINSVDAMPDPTERNTVSDFYSRMFRNSGGLGMYFFAGFIGDIYVKNYSSKICAAFVHGCDAIHLGGCYNNQKIMKVSSISYSQQGKSLDYFVGSIKAGNDDESIFVPYK